jgi:hypothetical protein
MIYDEPLISGTMLLVGWAVLGAIGALALTVVVLLRKAPPLTTQIDHTTGMRHHGMLSWLGGFLLVLSGPPMAILVVKAAMIPAAWLWQHWWLLLVGAVVGVSAWAVLRLRRQERDVEWVEQEPLPHNPMPTGPPAVTAAPPPEVWSPTYSGQWNRALTDSPE